MPEKTAAAPGGQGTKNASASALPAWKKALFACIAIAGFFGVVEVALALFGVRPVLYQEDPYVGFASNIPLFVEERDANGEDVLTTSPNKIRWFNKQQFPKRKAPGTFRIFSLGGSTTYGHPYDDRASFSGWLREMLAAAAPERNWEVINAGGISYASYRVAVVMEELARYEPDLFIIYSGHNEFLERRTYGSMSEAPRLVSELGGLASRTRLYAAARRLLVRPAMQAGGETGRTALKPEVDTMLDHSVGPIQYTRDDELRDKIVEHYRFNLNRMLDIAGSAGAKVILVTPASNEKDSSPFKSEHAAGLSREQIREFDRAFNDGRQALDSGHFDDAAAALDRALAIDGRYADAHYERALALYGLERFVEAGQAFSRALDEDICPLRAIDPLLNAVREVAAARNVPLIDFARLMEERSAHGITGSDYFLDHVHLTADGYRLLAQDLLSEMEREGEFRLPADWESARLPKVEQTVEGRIDRQAEGVALRNLAKVLDWAGKQQEAARLAERAAGLLGEDAESLNVLGRAAESRGEIDEAIRYFRAALRVKPDYIEPLTPLGIALGKKGQLDEAIALFREAIEGKPDFAEAYYNLGITLMAKGETGEAIASYRQALAVDPENAAAHNNLGAALATQKKYDEAAEHYRRALGLRPKYAEARLNLGLALQAMGKTREGAVQLRQALADNPESAETLANMGNLALAQGRTPEAIGHYREALRLRPESAEAHFNLGYTLFASGDPDGAIREYREAIRIRPKFAEALTNLGNALRQQNKTGEAIARYREAIAASPDNAEPELNLGLALESQGRGAEAATHYRRAIEIEPGYADAHANLGNALLSLGRTDDAIASYRKAIELRPGFAEAHYNLGVALGTKKDLAGAVDHFQRAIQIKPDYAEAHYYLATALEMLGRGDEANSHFETARRLRPDLAKRAK